MGTWRDLPRGELPSSKRRRGGGGGCRGRFSPWHRTGQAPPEMEISAVGDKSALSWLSLF